MGYCQELGGPSLLLGMTEVVVVPNAVRDPLDGVTAKSREVPRFCSR
ncbi:hypothetical protein [Legionella maceachernii]|nr:hypothetical protein [Legionella maceachernii]